MAFREWLRGLSHENSKGEEVLDPRPVEMPIGFEHPESIQETIRRLVTDPMIRAELEDRGAESFDDADDFDIRDDTPVSPHEENFDPMHLLTREMETLAGAVSPRTAAEVQAAKDAIDAYRKANPVKAPSGSAEPKATA